MSTATPPPLDGPGPGPGPDDPDDPDGPPPPPDPWKGLRGVMAGTLVLEAIVVLLALPVIATLGGGVTLFAGVYVLGLAVAMVLGAGLQRRPWALAYDLGLQLVFIGGFLLHPAFGVAGLIFAFVWAFILVIRRDVAQRLAAGTLRSQRPA